MKRKSKKNIRGQPSSGVSTGQGSRLAYSASAGSPFSDEDMGIIGPELRKIADENRVDELRSLDRRLVVETLEKDPDHPLWTAGRFDRDYKSAARKHWLAHAGLMIRSVRVVVVDLSGRPKTRPSPGYFFVPAEVRTREQNGIARRSHVVAEDVLRDDPAFASALGAQVRIITGALQRLEHMTSMRDRVPSEVVLLRDRMRASVDDYLASLESDKAAE